MTTIISSTPARSPGLPSVQTVVIGVGTVIAALLLWAIGASQGSAKATLFLVGLGLGVTLFH